MFWFTWALDVVHGDWRDIELVVVVLVGVE